MDNDRKIQDTHRILRESFRTGKTKSLEWRKEQLLKLQMSLVERKDKFIDALKKDLERPYHEALAVEIGGVIGTIAQTIKDLDNFAKETVVNTPSGPAKIMREPKGTVLVMGAFNFPLSTCVERAIQVIAAGNCVVLKPNELVPTISEMIAELVSPLDQDCITVVRGDVSVATELLALRWDHICFTGSSRVGRIVATAAAKHLTPITLELGGKCPVIVDKNIESSVKVLASRLLIGKWTNAGQICVAPDYILCHNDSLELFKETLLDTLKNFYGGDFEVDLKESPNYGRMVNELHWDRVMAHLKDDAHKGEILCGGRGDREKKFIEPTLILNPDVNSSVMKEEVFGPLLPIITVNSIEEAVEFVSEREKPLVLYLFSEDEKVQEYVAQNTSSGQMAINDGAYFTVDVPHFGGVGESGMGYTQGQIGFDEFSHLKCITCKPIYADPSFLFPPYDESATNQIWDSVTKDCDTN